MSLIRVVSEEIEERYLLPVCWTPVDPGLMVAAEEVWRGGKHVSSAGPGRNFSGEEGLSKSRTIMHNKGSR